MKASSAAKLAHLRSTKRPRLLREARKVPAQIHRGAVAVELALITPVFLLALFGLLELSITVFQYHIVSEAARQGARHAIVRGAFAGPELTEWGPPADDPDNSLPAAERLLIVKATDDHEVAELLQPYLAGLLNQDATTISLNWPDGTNKIESPVRVTVTTSHQPFLTFLFSSGWTLTGESTMQIAH